MGRLSGLSFKRYSRMTCILILAKTLTNLFEPEFKNWVSKLHVCTIYMATQSYPPAKTLFQTVYTVLPDSSLQYLILCSLFDDFHLTLCVSILPMKFQNYWHTNNITCNHIFVHAIPNIHRSLLFCWWLKSRPMHELQSAKQIPHSTEVHVITIDGFFYLLGCTDVKWLYCIVLLHTARYFAQSELDNSWIYTAYKIVTPGLCLFRFHLILTVA